MQRGSFVVQLGASLSSTEAPEVLTAEWCNIIEQLLTFSTLMSLRNYLDHYIFENPIAALGDVASSKLQENVGSLQSSQLIGIAAPQSLPYACGILGGSAYYR